MDNQVVHRKLDTFASILGTNLITLMKDPNVSEVILNSDGKVWATTFDQGQIDTGFRLSPAEGKRIIYYVASLSNTTIDLEKKSYLEAEIAKSVLFGRARFQGELPPIVMAPSFNIRKQAIKVYTLDDYVAQGTMTPQQHAIIMDAIVNRKNIIAAGGTNSGKTTFLNAVLNEMSKLNDRLIIIEDTPELQCTAKNHECLRTKPPYVDMDTLLRITLRKSPKRIVVGEVRGKEALTLLTAWSTGHRGGCSTVHSDSAIETLDRLEEMVSEVSLTPQQPRIGRAVDIVIYLKYEVLKRTIEDIIEVQGYDKKRQTYNTKKLDIM